MRAAGPALLAGALLGAALAAVPACDTKTAASFPDAGRLPPEEPPPPEEPYPVVAQCQDSTVRAGVPRRIELDSTW